MSGLNEPEREDQAGISDLAIRVAQEIWIHPRRDDYETAEDALTFASRFIAAEALRGAAEDMDRLNHGDHRPPEPYLPAGTSGAIKWLRDRADALEVNP